MTEPKTQFDLMRLVAKHLAGRSCIVRIGEPVTTNSLGTVTIRGDGMPVISIDPLLGQWAIHTFLHEVAHVKLHAGKMAKSSLDKARPRSVTVSKEQKQPTWEDQADALRDRWLNFGKAHADPTL